MMIAHAVVDAIYTTEPSGRFLKVCKKTGQWRELSRKEATNKAAQAMAYAIRAESQSQAKRTTSAPEQSSVHDLPLPSSLNPKKSAGIHQWRKGTNDDANGGGGNDNPRLSFDESSSVDPSLQQRLTQTTHFNTVANNTAFPPSLGCLNAHQNGNGNGLTPLARAYLLQQAQIQQRQHEVQRQMMYHQYLMGQHVLQSRAGLLPSSLPSSDQSLLYPGSSLTPNAGILLRDNTVGMGAQLSSLQLQQQQADPNNNNALRGWMSSHLPNQSSTVGPAIAPQQQALAQLAASNGEPQFQMMGDLPRHQIALLQRISQHRPLDNAGEEKSE